MQQKLTNRTVQNLTPQDKLYKVHDTEIKGFQLYVMPSGKMSYYMDYRNTNGQRKSYRIGNAGNLTPAQARQAANEAAARIALGQDPQAHKQEQRATFKQARYQTLDGFLTGKYESWATNTLKSGPHTITRVRRTYADLLPLPMHEINTWRIDSWRNQQIKAGKAKTTINRDVAALRTVLSKAVEWGVLTDHPLQKLKPLKVDQNKNVRYLSEDEETRLRDALTARDAALRADRINGNDWRMRRGYECMPAIPSEHYPDHMTPMVLLSINTGIRKGELLSLQWQHVNRSTKSLEITGRNAKSGLTRHLPLNDEAMNALTVWRQSAPGDDLIFPSRTGKRMDNVDKAWKSLLKAAQIEQFRWHDLRHHFASRLVTAGVPLNTVRELLGHADLKTTLRYAHLAPDHKAEAVSRLVNVSAN